MNIINGLAIDPGTTAIGYAFFTLDINQQSFTITDYGHFKASSHKPLEIRLHQIFLQFQVWMKPPLDIIVTEQSFSNPRFPGGGDTVRESLGVLKVVAVSHSIPITLLRPSDGKWAVVGKVSATKLEVAEGVAKLGFSLPLEPKELIQKKQDHITDAISLAIAYAFTHTPTLSLFDKKGELLCGHSKAVPKTSGKNGKSKRTKKNVTKETIGTTATKTDTTPTGKKKSSKPKKVKDSVSAASSSH